MTLSSIRKPIVTGFGLATTLLLSVAGCGGDATTTDDAVVVTDPSATVTTSGAAPASPAGGTATTPATTVSTSPAAAPSAPAGKAEGWGTLKGQVTLSGNPPTLNPLAAKGKASKDPEVCAKEAPIPNEVLVVDASSKGVKNVLVYIPKPTAINDEA